MGLFDWLTGKREEPEEAAEEMPARGSKPFKISHKFSPLRLKAHKDSKLAMNITVRNTSGSKQLVSVDVEVPKGNRIGFDVASSQKHHEERMGELAPGATKCFSVNVHGGNLTKPGEVPVKITAYAHYLNYNKVLEQTAKMVTLRVI
ncbi:hypothetical protein GF412_01430 [Candidatus Micrarchaeota archaeon]|nr:hypothetical protein [Candidatus Micrarchaeota archaeon]MBD3417631.1 hypothetical protein [Candidatus Micrarchaeota archaeon]